MRALRPPETSLWLVSRPRPTPPPPRLERYQINTKLLVIPGIQPNKMRKGKSGEIPR